MLSTENVPGFQPHLFGQLTPFTCEVWFVSKTEVLDLKLGMIEPMQLMDRSMGFSCRCAPLASMTTCGGLASGCLASL